MCLLIHKPANVTFTEAELRDFYTRNRDGYGVMFAEGDKLHSEKALGSVEDWLKFYRSHEHREMCIHLRMRTHGDIDLTNCHPYPVFGFEVEAPDHEYPLLLMHNGVLRTGNAKDATKSDTWHYIRDFLRPLLETNPEFVHSPQFRELVGAHIGNNRFALMGADGAVAIVNRSQGVEYKGAWFSNTYAWDARRFMPPPPIQQWKGDWQYHDNWLDAPRHGAGAAPTPKANPPKATPHKSKPTPKANPPKAKAKPVSGPGEPHEHDYLEVEQVLWDLNIDGVSTATVRQVVDKVGLQKTYALLECAYTGALRVADVANVFKSSAGLAEILRTPMSFFTDLTNKAAEKYYD